MCENIESKVVELRKQGLGYKKISKELGINRGKARYICVKYGLNGFRADSSNNPNKAFEYFIKTFNEYYGNRYLYVGGYTDSDNDVILECKVCNTKRIVNVQSIRKNRPIHCLECIRKEKEEMALKEYLLTLLIKRHNDIIKITKEKEDKEKWIKEHTKVCIECGNKFIAKNNNSKCCSSECGNKRQNRIKELKRRILISRNGKVNWNISLTKLIKRDNNTCHICGGKCDSEDYFISDEGYYIVGSNYPSIDHVLPVSKGGTHTWDNIKLAHHYCNTIKSNNEVYEESNGQFTLAI
ncbi:MAG: HNH endonuclease [Oligella ureolytica]|nr:HNH endonuclease [Oligella ureolytica]